MIIEDTPLPGLFLLTPEVKGDDRGFFMEVYRSDIFSKFGLSTDFVQANHTRSKQGVLRGMHFQWEPALGKLIRIIRGTAFSVVVDIRHDSPTLGQYFTQELSDENKRMLYAPPGFAAGFCVLSDFAEVEYHYTALYNPAGEGSIKWNDPRISIPWPITDPIVSERDARGETLDAWLARPEAKLFSF